MNLLEGWKVKDFDPGEKLPHEIANPEFIDYFWLETKVPVDVHTVLKDRGLIEDPFFGHNDVKCQWVEEKEWWFRNSFQWNGSIKNGERIELTFGGLDTFATIYLNGLEIGTTENMFMEHTFDVTRLLKKGKNLLAIKFDPVSKHVGNKIKYHWSGFSKERIWTRKMQSQYGWDWGPRLVTAGIWQDVELNIVPEIAIKDVYAFTKEITDHEATVCVDVTVKNLGKSQQVTAILSNEKHQFSQQITLTQNSTTLEIKVPNPDLWWTHDLGKPHLYELKVILESNGKAQDSFSTKLGIRTIEVMTEDAFTFVLNGTKVFAKGANWIPIDSFVAGVPDERYESLIDLAVNANMNMLRVWGGGIYEKYIFYQKCDEKGVLIWQDFMFACSLYPDYNKNFMGNVQEEVQFVVKKLRNHPSLALWCGNNENDWLHEALLSSGEIDDPFYGESIYHDLIPNMLSQLDPNRFYWPSSPFGGNDHNSRELGDTHNWQVWHGNIEPRRFGEPQLVDYSVEGLSFKKFKNDDTLFCSEFGMHASSNVVTLKENIPADQYYWGSVEMDYRNKDIHHQKGILLMEGYTGIPQNIDDYVKFSMLTQAEGLKFGVEHYRRNNARTSGALIWQLNDCWPGTSWSMIDYYQLPKASYYYAKRFFQPNLYTMDFDEKNDHVSIYVVNDLKRPVEDTMNVSVITFDGKILYEKEWEIHCEAGAATQITQMEGESLLPLELRDNSYIKLESKCGSRNLYFLKDQKDLILSEGHLHADVDLEKQSITLTSDVFIRMATIEAPKRELLFSENFVDLEPNVPYTISLEKGKLSEEEWRNLHITAFNALTLHIKAH